MLKRRLPMVYDNQTSGPGFPGWPLSGVFRRLETYRQGQQRVALYAVSLARDATHQRMLAGTKSHTHPQEASNLHAQDA